MSILQLVAGGYRQSLWNRLLKPLSLRLRDPSVTPWQPKVARKRWAVLDRLAGGCCRLSHQECAALKTSLRLIWSLADCCGRPWYAWRMLTCEKTLTKLWWNWKRVSEIEKCYIIRPLFFDYTGSQTGVDSHAWVVVIPRLSKTFPPWRQHSVCGLPFWSIKFAFQPLPFYFWTRSDHNWARGWSSTQNLVAEKYSIHLNSEICHYRIAWTTI